jgi:succinate dehydrogenase/fumarate reductase flavoprotein subunit
MPVSHVPRKDGSFGLFPHAGSDRGKPGFIAINRSGHRFVSEAAVYHHFVQAMIEASGEHGTPEAFIICDSAAIRRYGLGNAKPFPFPLRPHLDSGYFTRADTVPALAVRLGVDPNALARTVDKFNENAARGSDPEFSKGRNAFERSVGDPSHKPHPNLAPLRKLPFYAVKVVPADVGTFVGLRTDSEARVLDAASNPIARLYAVGADMANIFGGHSPGGGITLGPALTFGYLIGRSIMKAGVALPANR